ncbi:uncharacterized protein METZ01_LOCUS247961, partial [marine metagenome]
ITLFTIGSTIANTVIIIIKIWVFKINIYFVERL